MGIVVTGAVVRLTGSGLGCNTWPHCTAGSFTPHEAMGIHSFVEFGNRLLTFVLVAVAIGALVRCYRIKITAQLMALIYGIILEIIATIILGFGTNWLSAGLALIANLFYVFVYSMLLKRRTWQNTIWGGIAGCFPPLIGWTAVTGSVRWEPLVLFFIVFWWTPPHTWALSFRYREDYEAAGVPMLPVVRDAPEVTIQILIYTVMTVATSLVLWPVAHMGWIYVVVAVASGAVFIVEAAQLLRRANAGLRDALLKPMGLFHWSNTYLSLLFLAIAVDPLIHL
jgi:protoheme IX farnesyltransferase